MRRPIKPTKPLKPSEPLKKIMVPIEHTQSVWKEESFTLEDIANTIGLDLYTVKIEDIQINVDVDSSYDGSITVRFGWKEIDNQNYDIQYKNYEKGLVGYEEKLSVYRQKLVKYEQELGPYQVWLKEKMEKDKAKLVAKLEKELDKLKNE